VSGKGFLGAIGSFVASRAALPCAAGKDDDDACPLAPEVDTVVAYGMRAGPAAAVDRIVGPGREVASLFLLCLALLAGPAAAGAIVGKVVSVQDGDTLTVLVDRRQVRVRLTDIDAPERKQAFGTRSRQSLSEICAGKDAQIADQGKDRYGRTLGRVICAGVDSNAEQVRRGMAWVFVRYAPKDSPLYQLERAARLD
jgi:endonuclease YncB( thermonuclease family)